MILAVSGIPGRELITLGKEGAKFPSMLDQLVTYYLGQFS